MTAKNAIINCTGETYLKDLKNNSGYIDKMEEYKLKKNLMQFFA